MHLRNVNEDGVANSGYDVVSCFDGKPGKGTPEFSAQHNGMTFYFESAGNQSKFVSQPDKYAPQYNGWCAIAVSEGNYYYSDPESFIIQDGKLFLFFNDHAGGDTRPQWNLDPKGSQQKADDHWAADDISEAHLSS